MQQRPHSSRTKPARGVIMPVISVLLVISENS